jgi:hypothetical protein
MNKWNISNEGDVEMEYTIVVGRNEEVVFMQEFSRLDVRKLAALVNEAYWTENTPKEERDGEAA